MSFIIWLVVGGIIGWIASMIMRTDAQQGALMNIVVGIVGAFLGGWLGGMLLGDGGTINNGDFSISGLLMSLLGAVVLLAIVNMFRRGRAR
ncbi:MAG: GlsB/YeaQ/YmgE family stress response membrane protein [Lysobacter sp.]|nr:MAG: GlsB/YeaQ/YmgE family stress response membrane protein [Lysobacter sp.]